MEEGETVQYQINVLPNNTKVFQAQFICSDTCSTYHVLTWAHTVWVYFEAAKALSVPHCTLECAGRAHKCLAY